MANHWVLTRGCFCVFTILSLAGCASYPGWLQSSGPSKEQVQNGGDGKRISGIQLVDVNDQVTRKLRAGRKLVSLADSFGAADPSALSGPTLGAGDVVEVNLWEAPPAVLFGGPGDARTGITTTQMTRFPEQMVGKDGVITIPFAGQISVIGLTPSRIEQEIAARLSGKANQPQVLVRVIRNVSANVTVVGEVANSINMPISAKGERLLDAIAAAGGVRQPVSKMTVQVTRGNLVRSLPLEGIIRDPEQNIVLKAGDVITASNQPLSFAVLGATGKNDEINFEASGISLAQALARSGGLADSRADARAVFVFRLESPAALDWPSTPVATPDGKVPVIFQLDLKDPASFFVAQNFQVENRDVLYVSNAPAAELQKFLNIVTSVAYPILTVVNITN